MKTKSLYIYLILAVIFTTACDDDDKVQDDTLYTSSDLWEGKSGVYRGKMSVEIEGVPVDTFYQQAYITSDNRKKMNLRFSTIVVDESIGIHTVFFRDLHLKEEGGTVTLSGHTVQNMGPVSNAVITLSGTMRGENMELHLVAESNTAKTIVMQFNSEKVEEAPSDDARILEMRLDHPVIVSQPDITGNTITFFIADTMTITDSTELFIKPTFKLAPGATISYPDSVMDFLNTKRWPRYTVWAEDSIQRREYYVRYRQASLLKYDFNTWFSEGEYSEPKGNWATNNGYFKMLKETGQYDGEYPVTRTKGYRVGQFGAHMKTVLVGEGTDRHIVAGSFFQGRFDEDRMDDLNGSVYGTSFEGRPEKIKGYYKYIPGDMIFHRDTLLSDTLVVNDSCRIQAILYEAATPETTLDSINFLNDTKVVAIAEMTHNTGELRQNFTEFNIYFDYIRGYFTTKRYKIALICSPSKHSLQLWGSPQSELTISDVEVMYKKNK